MNKMKNAASMSQNQAFRSNTPSDATDAEIVQESVLKGMQNAVDKALAGMPEGEMLDTLKQNLIAESMSTLGLDSTSVDKSFTIDSQSGITNLITRKPFHPTSHLSLLQGNRGFLDGIGDVIEKLVKKGIEWLGKLFGGSRMGSFGNRGMNQMMSMKQDSVDVAL